MTARPGICSGQDSDDRQDRDEPAARAALGGARPSVRCPPFAKKIATARGCVAVYSCCWVLSLALASKPHQKIGRAWQAGSARIGNGPSRPAPFPTSHCSPLLTRNRPFPHRTSDCGICGDSCVCLSSSELLHSFPLAFGDRRNLHYWNLAGKGGTKNIWQQRPALIHPR